MRGLSEEGGLSFPQFISKTFLRTRLAHQRRQLIRPPHPHPLPPKAGGEGTRSAAVVWLLALNSRLSSQQHHPGHCACGFTEDRSTDPVDSRDIDDRVEHQDVFATDVRSRLARGERADHQLGNAERQCAHGRCSDGRSRRTAERQNATHFSSRLCGGDDVRHTERRHRHRLSAIILITQQCQRRTRRREDLLARDVCRDTRRTKTTGIDNTRRHAVLVQQVADEGDLKPLRVERSEQIDRHDCATPD